MATTRPARPTAATPVNHEIGFLDVAITFAVVGVIVAVLLRALLGDGGHIGDWQIAPVRWGWLKTAGWGFLTGLLIVAGGQLLRWILG